jgi:hypothetical protein
MNPMIKVLALSASVTLLATPGFGETTHVMVRAQAYDAKFIGDHMGGVRITLTDARSGKVLAKGLVQGGTGDTPRIMKSPKARGDQISDTDTAGFDAALDIARPTLVQIRGVGPLGKPESSVEVSSSLWVIPGRDILGDGVVLTFPGLVIEPAAAVQSDGLLHLQATVSPMCGCPIDAGGLWDAANYTVHALLSRRGRQLTTATLAFTGKTGQFAGALPKPPRGRYTVQLVATDAKSLNAGAVTQVLTVGR